MLRAVTKSDGSPTSEKQAMMQETSILIDINIVFVKVHNARHAIVSNFTKSENNNLDPCNYVNKHVNFLASCRVTI